MNNDPADKQNQRDYKKQRSHDNPENQAGYNQHQEDYKDPQNQDGSHYDESQRRDGYADTQGQGSGDSKSSYGKPISDTPAQQGYDARKSGVKPAQNQPGRRADSPGRETGTSWGQDEQMGYATDRPDRKNPAN
jgi:hypothetical protein